MRMSRLFTALAWLSLLSLSIPSGAVQPKQESSPLDRLTVVDPRLRSAAVIEPIEEAGTAVAPGLLDVWGSFQREQSGGWQGYVDRRNGLLEIAEGSGIPWIPGPGNQLSREDVAPHLAGEQVDLAALEKIARGFLPRVAPLLGVDPRSLRLSPGRSGQGGGYLWVVDFDVLRDGIPVEGARVVFRINNGNLVQLGSENLPSAGAQVPREAVSRKQALGLLSGHVGGFSAADTFLDGGSLHLLPIALADDGFQEGFAPGAGRGLALVWQFTFQRRQETGTWQARIDAATGELLEFRDVNVYGKANGGVFPEAPAAGGEVVLPMPFADLSTGGFTDGAGRFPFSGSAVSSTLSGSFVDIDDSCGSISLAANATGRIAFGTSAGTDCATPGVGGTGNTHSARTQFYHLNRAKEIARGWLPGNTWLNSPLPANVNLFDTCNAFWNGASVNFFRSGGGCGNTGEVAAISLHEYGHGLDDNDGNDLAPDLGTAETYGDFTAALTLHKSCMGPGFFSSNCGGYGDACTSCSGVRDIDWAKHVSNTPHTVGNFTQVRCPSGGGYDGPCGREGHCESYVSSEALWDFVARDLPSPGTAAAWRLVERLWYLTRPTATSAFTCNTATSTWTSNGCGTGSLWRVMRLADDDDGNLANGTPHSCHLFAAFDRHGLACAADQGANVCFSACTPPAVPAVTLTPGADQIEVSWTSSGAGTVYDVYKSERSCDSGFIKVANDLAGPSFLDSVVTDGLSYSYQVIAHPSGNEACGAQPSGCQSATPTLPPCATSAPTGVTATANGLFRIDLSWNAVSGATAYVIYRATASGGPYTERGSVAAPATAWSDTGLAEGTTYHYVVRAFANCESAASAQVSATTDTCNPFVLYSNDFETGSGLSDWTKGVFPNGASPSEWQGIQACAAHSGSKIFRFGGSSSCIASYSAGQSTFAQPLGATGITVPEGSLATRLSFWHRWDFEFGYDGGNLALSLDGSSYTTIPASAIVGGANYNGQQFQDCGPAGTVGRPIFTGSQSQFVNTVVDLDAACNLASGETSGCSGRTVWMAFVPVTDCIVQYPGWYIDDVTVSVCGPDCTAPGAPVIGTASTPANNQIQVNWVQGAPPADRFNVYRAAGTCAAPGPFSRRAQQLSGSPYLDAPVSGGSTYAYRVTGVDATGFCESTPSACVNATATGPCLFPPTFAGLAAAGNVAQSTCGVQLSWPAGSSGCGTPLTYNIYRSTSPTFTPGPANRVATGVTATSHLDAGSLASQTTYYYIVRAVDGVSGVEDANTVVRSAAPTGPTVSTTLADTFEGSLSGGGFDLGGWTHAPLSGSADWAWSTARSQSPTHSWLSPSQDFAAHRALVSPSFRAQSTSTVSFWHTYEMEAGYDGGTLEISANGGASWTILPDSAFTLGGFNATLFPNTQNPLSGRRAWSGGPLGTMTEVRASLAAWAGSDVKLRWHAGEDGSTKYTGWFVDSVAITDAVFVGSCQPELHPLDYYSLPPCRLVDTRNPNGPLGGPALSPGAQRSFGLAGVCGIPATAKALSYTLTAAQPAAAGYLTLFPQGLAVPTSSSINFPAGQTRGNNGILPLGEGGALRVLAGTSGPVHFILDVTGYFE
jgi:trimeric autotransporter adhesin